MFRGKKLTEYLSNTIGFIEREISFTKELILSEQNLQSCPLKRETTRTTKLQWTGSISELTELLISLRVAEKINNGEITIKDLFSMVGVLFNFPVKNYYQCITEMTHRTGERTLFLDKLKDKFKEYLTKLDNR